MIDFENLTEEQRSCIPDVRFELIPIRNLVSNQDYQRDLKEGHITSTALDFNIYQIKPVKVSHRDGINYVVDGQHTIEIIAAKSGSRDTPVWCMIYDNLSYQEEAHIFAEQQKHVKALVPYEVFNAHVEAGDHKQTMINYLVTNVYKQKIINGNKPGCISAVTALQFIYDKYGYETLDRTLRIALGTWEGEKMSLSSGILKGIAQIITAYGESLNEDSFIEHVGRITPKAISRTAHDRHPGAIGYAEALILAYNKATKKRLSLQKLYWSSSKRKGAEPPDYETE